jgi:hypothetical protein
MKRSQHVPRNAMHAALLAIAVAIASSGALAADDREAFYRRAAASDAALFDALDRDGNGMVTRQEAQVSIDMQARFDDFDIDRDGAITRAELERYVGQRYGVVGSR